jgi:Family of unknown function (DUF6535)
MAERWQKDADGILIFVSRVSIRKDMSMSWSNILQTGLFSAAVAALLAVTVLDLRTDSHPQYTSAFYLEKIYRVLAVSGSPNVSFPSTMVLLSPPRSVIWVNSLWVLSLVISLTCAGLATLVQQWARRYVKFIQRPRYSPHQRMRVRTFFSYGVIKFHVSWLIEALLLLIHISLFLFFAGLLVFLSAVNHPLFGAIAWWMVLSTTAYMLITLLPVFWPNSPYYTPFSSAVWLIYTGVPFLVCEVLSSPLFGTSRHFHTWRDHYHKRFVEGMGKTAEKTASQRSLEIDVRVMMSTLEAVTEDDALAEFFEFIPSFLNSDQVDNLEERLVEEFQIKFSPALNGFLDRTFSSDSVSESTKTSRLKACLNATHAVLGSDSVSQILFDILNGRWQELFQSVEVAGSLKQWSKNTNDEFRHYVQRIVTRVVASARLCDERWISLVVDEFRVPDHVLRLYMGHGDSMLLSLLLYVVRQTNQSRFWTPWVLSSLCQFNVCNALPELRHNFCALWNEIVQEAWRDGRNNSTAINILREIRHAYISLHRSTDAIPTAFSAHIHYFNPVLAQPRSYRFCNVASHRSHVTQAPVTVLPSTAAIPFIPSSTAQLDGSPDPISRVPSSTDSPPRSYAHTLTHRHTYPSLSPSPPPMEIAQRATSVDVAYVPESIESTTMHDRIIHRRNPLIPTEVSRHARRRPALSLSASPANIARPRDSIRHIYPNQREETSQAASLSTLPLADTLTFTDSPSSIGPNVPSFSEPSPIHVSPYPMDWSPTPDAALPPVRSTTRSSRPLRSNGRPAALKVDIAAPLSAPCSSEIPSTAKPIPRTMLPTGSGATARRNEEVTTVVPSISVSDLHSSSGMLPPLSGDMVPPELYPLRSAPSSPSTPVSYSPLQESSVLAVHVTAGALSISDGPRGPRPPIPMESVSPDPGAEYRQHDNNNP